MKIILLSTIFWIALIIQSTQCLADSHLESGKDQSDLESGSGFSDLEGSGSTVPEKSPPPIKKPRYRPRELDWVKFSSSGEVVFSDSSDFSEIEAFVNSKNTLQDDQTCFSSSGETKIKSTKIKSPKVNRSGQIVIGGMVLIDLAITLY